MHLNIKLNLDLFQNLSLLFQIGRIQPIDLTRRSLKIIPQSAIITLSENALFISYEFISDVLSVICFSHPHHGFASFLSLIKSTNSFFFPI